MWVISIFTGIWWAYEFITLILQNRFDFLTRVVVSVPLGILYQSLYIFVLQVYIPWGYKLTIIVDSTLAAMALLFQFLGRKAHPSLVIRLTYVDLFSLGVSIIWLIFRMDFINLHGEGESGGACYSDHAFHFNLITSFAIGINKNRKSIFDIEFPISAGDKLSYPCLPNFYTSFLAASCNLGFRMAFRIPTFLVGISWFYLLHHFIKSFCKSSFAATIGLPLWVFSGGLGWLEIFENGFLNYYSAPNYIHRWSRVKDIFWFQSMSHIFNPQRSATFVLPLCGITYLCLWHGTKKFDWRYFVIAALAVGIMPQTQVHAYVSLALFSIFLAVTTFSFKYFKRMIGCWLLYGTLANLIAFPFMVPYAIRTVENKEFVVYKPVWTNPTFGQGGFFHIFWNALGCTGAISLIFGFVYSDAQQTRYYLATFPVLLIAATIMFQPWELDNTKILHDGWFPVAVAFTANYLTKLISKTKNFVFMFIISIIYLSMILSGLINLYTTESFLVPFYNSHNKEAGQWTAENTPVHAIFHYHKHVICPSACFAGRVIFSGYPGWTQSHGVTNTTRASSFFSLDEGNNINEYKKYDIKYAWKSETQPDFNSKFMELIMERGTHRLYKVMDNPPLNPDEEVSSTDTNKVGKIKPANKKKKRSKRTFNF